MSVLAHEVRFLIAHYGLIALFILLTIEEAGVWLPLPGDLLVVYYGYLIAHSPTPTLTAIRVVAVVTLAVLCGSGILYTATHRYRYAILHLGHFFHLDEQRLHWMENWLQKQGPVVIIPGRLIPGLRIPTTVVAALFDIPLSAFIPSVTFAAFLWALLYLSLGIAGRSLLMPLRTFLEAGFWIWLAIAVATLCGLATFWLWRRRFVHLGQH